MAATSKVARAEYNRQYRQDNKDRLRELRREWLNAFRGAVAIIKLDAGCTDCGYAERPEVLDFDHVSGTKLAAVARFTRSGTSRALDEIEKCDVVCANCHRIRTADRRQGE